LLLIDVNFRLHAAFRIEPRLDLDQVRGRFSTIERDKLAGLRPGLVAAGIYFGKWRHTA